MPYGKPKFSISEVKKQILEQIDTEISKNSDFSGDNLAVYGYQVEFSAKITLTTRNKETETDIKVNLSGGEPDPILDQDGEDEKEPVKEVVEVKGRRKHAAHQGS